MKESQNKKKDYKELELEEASASNVYDPENQANHSHDDEILQYQIDQDLKKKNRKCLCFLLLLCSSIICFGIYYSFFNSKKQMHYQYNGMMVEQCPPFTYLYNSTFCYDHCEQNNMFQRGKECVKTCHDSDFFIGNKCIITSCSTQDNINSQQNSNLQKNQSFFYDFSTHQCVPQCLSTQYKLFNEFCFENGCPKKEIHEILQQYYEKKQKSMIQTKEYEKFVQNFKQGEQNDIIVTSDHQKQECFIGCENQNKKYVVFDQSSGRFQCSDSCGSGQFTYKMLGQTICTNICPVNTYISLIKNECVESCGDLIIQNNKCARYCDSGWLQEGNKCVSSCSNNNPFIYKERTCVNSCLIDLKTKFVQNGKCVSDCFLFKSPIPNIPGAYECIPKCDLLSSTDNLCTEKCGENETEEIIEEGNQRKCIKLEICEDQNQLYVPDEMGCKNYCSTQFPFTYKQQCVNKCFKNYVVADYKCLTECPIHLPYIENRFCRSQCSFDYFIFNNTCVKQCPDGYWADYFSKICSKNCDGVYVLPEKLCFKDCPNFKPFRFNQECVQECPTNYFTYIYKNKEILCLKQCPEDTFKTPYKQCVKECPRKLFKMIETNSCVESCPHSYDENKVCKNNCEPHQRYIAEEASCHDVCPQTHYKLETNNQCVELCPKFRMKNKKENLCVSSCFNLQKSSENGFCVDKCSKFNFNGICVDECPNTNPYIQGNYCVQQCDDNKVYHEEKCLDKCPSDLYQIEDKKICGQECPPSYFSYIDEMVCKKECDLLILDNNICSKKCPLNSVEMNKSCQYKNQNVLGKFWNENKEIIDECKLEKGYYSQQRVCKKCNGGEGCKSCSIFFGICLECKSNYFLFNHQCISSCPPSFISKDGICIKDNTFFKNNLFFREYQRDQHKMKYSILQDNEYIKQEVEDETLNEEQDYLYQQYFPTVLIHLHDLNSTYLDFYFHAFNISDSIEILSNSVLKQGLSILTVQSPESLHFDQSIQLILQEILPSLGYFKAHVIFSGVGAGANSIYSSISTMMKKDGDDERNIKIIGNYLVDLKQDEDIQFIYQELTINQIKEVYNFFKVPKKEIFDQENIGCYIFKPYLKLSDLTYTGNENQPYQTTTMADSIVSGYLKFLCSDQDKQLKSLHMIQEFNETKQFEKQVFNEYASPDRKLIQYEYITDTLIQDVLQWKNSYNRADN